MLFKKSQNHGCHRSLFLEILGMGQMTANGRSDSGAETRVPSQHCRGPWGQVVHRGQGTWPWARFFTSNRARAYASPTTEAWEITWTDGGQCYEDLRIMALPLAHRSPESSPALSENVSEMQSAKLPAIVGMQERLQSQPVSRRMDSALSVHPFLLNHCSNL